MTAFGAGDSESVTSWFMKIAFIGGLLKGFYRDHDVQERMTRASGLDFVIARPMRLTNGPKTTPVRQVVEATPIVVRFASADEPTLRGRDWQGKGR